MREEVLVMPPSAERNKAGYYLSKTDEAAFNLSRECMAPEATYVKRSLHVTGVRKDLKPEAEANGLQSIPTERMQMHALRREEHTVVPALGLAKDEMDEEGRSKQWVRSLSIQQMQKELLLGALPFHWGALKKSRSSRGNRKQCNLVDESKPVPVEAVKDCSVPTSSNAVPMEDFVKSKNAASRKRDHPCSPPPEHTEVEEDIKREKRLRSADLPKIKRGIPVQGAKREEPFPHQCITRSSPGKKLELPNQVTPTNGIGAGPARKDFSLPKFVIGLSRKEIEEDFLIFKGSKIPKRPKRRSKTAERALYYCTPGTGLSDVCIARYTVKEKKNVKGKSRGLKAMENEDTDSE